MSKKLEAKYGSPDKPLKVGEIELQCYVLNDEKRVLVQRGLQSGLGMSTGGGTGGAQRIIQFIDTKSINPFISNDLRLRINNPIKFTVPSGALAYGYEATILIDICDAIIESRKQGLLHKYQTHIAERAEMLLRAFAKTGIIALVDEATGYQEVREKDSLRQFLEKFLAEEKAKWVKTFPDEFFEVIFKMKGWTWYYANSGKKPQVVGHYINDLVYSRIGPSVLEELRTKNPKDEKGNRKAKHTQWLTIDYGHPKLKEHLNILVALGKASGYNWNTFKRLVQRALPKIGSPLELDFNEDDGE
ncbi:MAG: P63C domain-containing protein [Ferruginibacter sp.]